MTSKPSFPKDSVQFDSVQLSSIQFKSVQFNNSILSPRRNSSAVTEMITN